MWCQLIARSCCQLYM